MRIISRTGSGYKLLEAPEEALGRKRTHRLDLFYPVIHRNLVKLSLCQRCLSARYTQDERKSDDSDRTQFDAIKVGSENRSIVHLDRCILMQNWH